MMVPLEESSFTEKLKAAVRRASSLLEESIRPVRLEEESHAYEDKFEVAEAVTCVALETVDFLLGRGFGTGSLVTFTAVETCDFSEERERETKGPKVTEKITESKQRSFLPGTSTKSSSETTYQVTTKVTEYAWKHELSYTAKDDDDGGEPLFERKASREVFSKVKDHAPFPKRKEHPAVRFAVKRDLPRKIDRGAASCKTPRRNAEVERVLAYFSDLAAFVDALRNILAKGHTLAAVEGSVEVVFSPAACCFLTKMNTESESESSAAVRLFEEASLAEMRRTFDEQAGVVRRSSSEDTSHLLGPDEAELLFCLALLEKTVHDYRDSVSYLESLLRHQLDAAIGKELTADAFDDYALYHDRLLFRADFRPAPFSYAVRRDATSFPDGTVAIVSKGTKKKKDPIRTFARDATAATALGAPFKFAIGAATVVTFDGPRYAHAYVARTFGGRTPEPLELVAKARPFSGYVLLLGKVAAKDEFVAERAVVVQSSDEVVVPLLLDPLPTPKEFADAIESLSPEQRDFCEAFRRMQLASSLYGVVVVQLKPAIEKVLNLPRGALVKEIALTDHLMELFIDYQIPTDILAYDGPADADATAKIQKVKAHVGAVRDIIDAARDDDLRKTKQASLHRKLKADVPVMEERPSLASSDGDDDDDGLLVMENYSYRRPQKSLGGGGLLLSKKAGKVKVPLRQVVHEGRHASVAAEKRKSVGGRGGPGGGPGGGGAAPPPPPPPKKPQQQQEQQEEERPQEQEQRPSDEAMSDEFETVESLDLTQLPKKLDANFKVLDTDSQLRPTTIKTGDLWARSRKPSIVADAATTPLGPDDLAKEKTKAFDLLDALSRSGALTLADAELHVIVCATHAFDKSITDTLVVDNVDPILKAERASLIIATTLHDIPAIDIVEPKKLPSLAKSSPLLLPPASAAETEGPLQSHDDVVVSEAEDQQD